MENEKGRFSFAEKNRAGADERAGPQAEATAQ